MGIKTKSLGVVQSTAGEKDVRQRLLKFRQGVSKEAQAEGATKDETFTASADSADDSNIPKTLAEKFGGYKNLIRLTPAQKKMYRKEGYSDVNDYKTILAPGTIFRPGYKPVYDDNGNKTDADESSNTGIGTAANNFGGATGIGSAEGVMKNFFHGNPDLVEGNAKVSLSKSSNGKKGSSGKKASAITNTPTVKGQSSFPLNPRFSSMPDPGETSSSTPKVDVNYQKEVLDTKTYSKEELKAMAPTYPWGRNSMFDDKMYQHLQDLKHMPTDKLKNLNERHTGANHDYLPFFSMVNYDNPAYDKVLQSELKSRKKSLFQSTK